MSRTNGSRAKYKAKRKEKRATQRSAGQTNKNAKPHTQPLKKKKRHVHARKALSSATIGMLAVTAAAVPPDSDDGDAQPPTSPVPASPNEAVADNTPAPEAAATP